MRWPGLGLVLFVFLAACGQGEAQVSSTVSPSPAPTETAPSTPSTTPGPAPTTTLPAGASGLLVFHKTAGFAHESIPAGIEALGSIADRENFQMTATDDAGAFTDETLDEFAAVVFLSTTGDVLDADQESAMERFIQDGGGFLGIHSAADTEYDWDWYGGLVGAYFAQHPRPQEAQLTVVSPNHPTMEGIPETFERFDEWYDFRSLPGDDVEVLITLDEASYEGGTMGDPHPITWAHEYDGGRAFYTGFGHTSESFSEEVVTTQLSNAVRWVTGRTD